MHQVAEVLELLLQHQSFQWMFGVDFLGISRDSQRVFSSTAIQKHQIFFRAKENKVCHCCPIYLPWNDGTGCHDLVFWMLSFKPAFWSSFTFVKRPRAKTWKRPKYPWTDEWEKKWVVCTLSGMLFRHKKEWNVIRSHLDRPGDYHTSEISQRTDISYVESLKAIQMSLLKQRHRKQIYGYLRVWKGRRDKLGICDQQKYYYIYNNRDLLYSTYIVVYWVSIIL